MYSTTLYHGSTWLHNTLPSLYLILPCLYLTLLESATHYHVSTTQSLPWLYFTLLESATHYHISTTQSLPWLYLTSYFAHSTMALFESTWLYFTLLHSSMALLDLLNSLHSAFYHGSTWFYITTFNHGSTWFYFTTFYHGSTWFYLTTFYHGSTWFYFTTFYHGPIWLYFTLATIHSTLAVLGSTLFFYILYGCTWFYILYSTTLYHSSSWLYITLLYSTIAVLQSATLSHASPLLQSIMVQLDSTSLTTLSWLNRNKPFFNANSISHNSVITITYYHME